jgi:pSer/pThr/pTyr-binding forkhead associated (FHA) protein
MRHELLAGPGVSVGFAGPAPTMLAGVDVGSVYGTYVNRERVESATLANGDKIYIGIFCLVVLKSRND